MCVLLCVVSSFFLCFAVLLLILLLLLLRFSVISTVYLHLKSSSHIMRFIIISQASGRMRDRFWFPEVSYFLSLLLLLFCHYRKSILKCRKKPNQTKPNKQTKTRKRCKLVVRVLQLVSCDFFFFSFHLFFPLFHSSSMHFTFPPPPALTFIVWFSEGKRWRKVKWDSHFIFILRQYCGGKRGERGRKKEKERDWEIER